MDDIEEFVESGEASTDVIEDVSSAVSQLQDVSSAPSLDQVEVLEPVVSTDVRTISPSNTNGLLSIMLDLIGDYDLVSKTVTYTGSSGYTNVQVTTETNYPWLCSCGIFALLLFCCCRFLGGVFSK